MKNQPLMTALRGVTPMLLMAASILLLVQACKKDEVEDPHEHCGHWQYDGEFGPEHWNDLSAACIEYAHCGGDAQSPVNISAVVPDSAFGMLMPDYGLTKTHIRNNGHTIEYEVEEGSTIFLDGDSFELKQFHFHAQSEHLIEDEPHHLEAHFVHVNEAGNRRLVIGVMFEDGEENPFFAEHANTLPLEANQDYQSEAEFNPIDLLPASRNYFTYSGSLTTPDCEENVTWIVLEHPVEASTAQILQFKDIMPKNYRPLAPLNGRIIRYFAE